MNGIGLQQRCWNHDAREAVCRCPACGRPYCRECVSEHEARLLCAACLSAQVRPRQAGGRRRIRAAALTLAGILTAWVLFYGAARAVLLVGSRSAEEAASQQN
jgi:hypothetical protein